MSNVIICESCGGKGRALDSSPRMDYEFPSFCHLGHDHYTGFMYYQCPYCGVLLSVDPMKMLEPQYVRGIPHKDKIAIYGNDKDKYYSFRSSPSNRSQGIF